MKMSPDSPLCFQKAGHLPTSCCRRPAPAPGALRLPEESRHFTLFLSPEPGLPLGGVFSRAEKALLLPHRLPCPP